VAGDLIEAIRWWNQDRPCHRAREWTMRILSRLNPDGWLQTAQRARRNIRFHYDRSNAFYQQFLDSRMVYSCAYFADPSWSLEEAQLAKLDHICRKLDLTLGDRFLDIGSGWGALIVRAAQRYQVQAMGCTLSHEQFSFATKVIAAAHLHDRVTVADRDYGTSTNRSRRLRRSACSSTSDGAGWVSTSAPSLGCSRLTACSSITASFGPRTLATMAVRCSCRDASSLVESYRAWEMSSERQSGQDSKCWTLRTCDRTTR
jgi:hypothetical protein